MPRPVFYGWWVVAAIFVMFLTSAGLGFYGLSLYLATLNEQKGFSISSLSFATAVFFVVSGLAGLLLARVLQRVDPRPVIAGGAALTAFALASLGHVRAEWQVYVVYAIFGAGFAASGNVIGSTVITRWFHRRRSVALSVAMTGLSVGGLAVTPLAGRFIERHGITTASGWIALAYVIGTVPLTTLLIRADPGRLGLRPDGDGTLSEASPASPPTGTPFDEAMQSAAFWAITIGFLLALGSQVGAIAHLVKLATERADRGTGRQAVQVLAACSVVGRLVGGAIVTRISSRAFAISCIAVQCGGLFTLGQADGRAQILAAAVLFGVVIGNVLLLHPLLLAERFGVRDYPRIFGRSQFLNSIGYAAGPLLVGWLHDHAGGYRMSFSVAAAISVAGLAVYTLGTRPAAALAPVPEIADSVRGTK